MEGKMETYCSELAGNVIPAHNKNVQTLPHSALKKTTGKHPSKTTQFQVWTSFPLKIKPHSIAVFCRRGCKYYAKKNFCSTHELENNIFKSLTFPYYFPLRLGRSFFSRGNNFPCYTLMQSIFIYNH